MDNVIWMLGSILIAAVIGYVTNYLAIKMLFYPRQPWTIGGKRVPFTPGLIPKRKGEIAVSLGRVVSEYLVTADGLRSMLQQPELRRKIEQKLQEVVEDWTTREETLEEIAVRLFGPDSAAKLQIALEGAAKRAVQNGVRSLWNEGEGGISGQGKHQIGIGTMHRPLSEWLAKLHIPAAQLIEQEGTPLILDALRSELSSTNGLRIIRQAVVQMMDGLSGMMGMLAGIFADEDKIARKVRDSLIVYLGSSAAREEVTSLLLRQVERFGERTPAQLLQVWRDHIEQNDDESVATELRPSDADWFANYVSQAVPWQAWLGRVWELSPKKLLHEHESWLVDKIPVVSERIIQLIVEHTEQVVRAVNLPNLVQEQVEKFPTERVEQVILSITGREFRAITWLGAVLGGLIGTLQALLYLWMGS